GMLGGLFNTLVAPVVFSSVAEYPLVVIAGCVLAGSADAAEVARSWRSARVPVLVAAATAAALIVVRAWHLPLAFQLAARGVRAVLAFWQRPTAARSGWAVAALLAAGLTFATEDGRVLSATRTFFGVYRVNEDASGRYHGLAHGTTLHGVQSLEPARRS